MIDLNADIGEGYPFDLALIPLISSANISCGAHAGSVADIQQAIAACHQQQVAIGAHPSYPDRDNFGRLVMPMSLTALTDSLNTQLDWFAQQVKAVGAQVHHVKTHGALYHESADNAEVASIVARLTKAHFPDAALVTVPQSLQADIAAALGLSVKQEAFADRAYLANARLVPRKDAGALLEVPDAIQQVLSLVQQQGLYCQDGRWLSLSADTICLHGDSAEALQLAKQLHIALHSAGIVLKKWGV